MDSAFVLQLYSIKQGGTKENNQGISEKNTSKFVLLYIHDVENSWSEMASSFSVCPSFHSDP